MPSAIDATPQIDLWLYKTISRSTLDGHWAVSGRYQGKDEYIDLGPFLHAGSVVRTSKSVREPAGGFSISFADQAHEADVDGTLESVYGLIEPMDIIEIRMWSGVGVKPTLLPIVMRGFVSQIQRSRVMGDDGRPQRIVSVSGQDYGKIWQTYQVLYFTPYTGGVSLLTNYQLFERIGLAVKNTMTAGEFVKSIVEKIINPHLENMLPESFGLVPRQITLGDGISVAHGVVNNSYQNANGSVYDILRVYGDVGTWNELYTEDREDGVHCIYRPIPAFLLSSEEDRGSAIIQDDAPTPSDATIYDYMIKSISETRSDAAVANFYWVNNSKFDLIDDIVRKQFGLAADDGSVKIYEYANSAVKYYGERAMYGETQQGEDTITNMATNLPKTEHDARSTLQMSWIDNRRRIMKEMNKDNVVYERGTAVVKGGPVRAGETNDLMKAGDYAVFVNGSIRHSAYVHTIEHEFMAFQSYTTTLHFDRGEGFAVRASMEGSPWLSEQARRRDDPQKAD